jgi:hypothetical protein
MLYVTKTFIGSKRATLSLQDHKPDKMNDIEEIFICIVCKCSVNRTRNTEEAPVSILTSLHYPAAKLGDDRFSMYFGFMTYELRIIEEIFLDPLKEVEY